MPIKLCKTGLRNWAERNVANNACTRRRNARGPARWALLSREQQQAAWLGSSLFVWPWCDTGAGLCQTEHEDGAGWQKQDSWVKHKPKDSRPHQPRDSPGSARCSHWDKHGLQRDSGDVASPRRAGAGSFCHTIPSWWAHIGHPLHTKMWQPECLYSVGMVWRGGGWCKMLWQQPPNLPPGLSLTCSCSSTTSRPSVRNQGQRLYFTHQ